MSRQHFLRELLDSVDTYHTNAEQVKVLEKFILLCHQGRLRINGQSPNKAYSLGEYLLDNRRIMLDWSRASEAFRKKLYDWLFVSHQTLLHQKLISPYQVNETHGKPEEKSLTWWEQILNGLLFKKQRYAIKWDPKKLTSNFKLSRMDFALSKSGALVDLIGHQASSNQRHHPVAKEYLDEGDLQNVKRLILSDEVIDRVTKEQIETVDLIKCISEPHPHSVDVIDKAYRKKRMQAYRENHGYEQHTSFWSRLIQIIKQLWFDLVTPTPEKSPNPEYKKLCKFDKGSIYYCNKTGSISVYEKRPDVDTFVFCGGGAKIFGHLGAVDALKQYGVNGKVFAGSSAGAIMAGLLFLGYESDALIREFSWVTDNLLLDYDIDLDGFSSTLSLKQALQNFLLTRVKEEIAKYPKWFETEDIKAFIAQNVDQGHITFRTIQTLKKICPKMNFGDELKVTGTNATKCRTEIFSTETTPNMEIAEAIKISASLPVIYKPTVKDGYLYKDGGILNNLPVSFFIDDDQQFVEHELGAYLRLMAFQFDNGIENDILHSNKPVYRENWLINFFYSFFSGVRDPASGWVEERNYLRKYSNLSIVIDVGNIRASKFDIDDATREKLMECGRRASHDYMKHRTRKTDKGWEFNEYMAMTFENLEEFMLYCGIKKKWHVLDKVKRAFNEPSVELSSVLKQRLNYVYECLIQIQKTDKACAGEKPARWGKVVHLLAGLDRMKKGVDKKENNDRVTIFMTLYPVLSQAWPSLISIGLQENRFAKQMEIFDVHRKRFYREDQFNVLGDLVEDVKKFESTCHLFFYLLKTLLLYGYEKDAFDEIKSDLLSFTNVFSLSRSSTIKTQDLIDDWDFDVEKCKLILEALNQNDDKRFYDLVGIKYYYQTNHSNESNPPHKTEHSTRRLMIAL